jgi:hypothetical protein
MHCVARAARLEICLNTLPLDILVEGHVPASDIKRLLAELDDPARVRAGLVGLSAPACRKAHPEWRHRRRKITMSC